MYVKYIDLKFFDEYEYDKYESPITPTGKEWMHQVLYYDQYEILIADGLHMHQVLCHDKYKKFNHVDGQGTAPGLVTSNVIRRWKLKQ